MKLYDFELEEKQFSVDYRGTNYHVENVAYDYTIEHYYDDVRDEHGVLLRFFIKDITLSKWSDKVRDFVKCLAPVDLIDKLERAMPNHVEWSQVENLSNGKYSV